VKKNSARPNYGHRAPSPDLIDKMALETLSFLAEDPDRLGRFFDLTGLTLQTLRAAAGTPRFDASLLDYLGSDVVLLRAFAERHGYDPGEVDAARVALSGRGDFDDC
jgi:hypothetical protein